jgi:anti-anti-sigma factor
MRPSPTPFTDFSVHVAPSPEGGTDVAIFGELDLATVERVEAALRQALEAEGRVVLDMRACPFVDSRGIAAIVKAALRLQERDREFVVGGVQERVMRIFTLAGLDSMEHVRIEPRDAGSAS